MFVVKNNMIISLEKTMITQVEGNVIGFYGDTFSRHIPFTDEELAHVEFEKIVKAAKAGEKVYVIGE